MSTALAKIDFTQDEIAVIRRQFFPASGTPEEQNYCFSVARHLGLNPITKEIFFIPRRQKVGSQWVEKIEPMLGRDGFLSIAHRSNQLAGMETTAGIREVPTMAGGQWHYRKELVAECRVWRKDSGKPFAVQVSYSEYVQKNNDGQPTRFWVEKPETMLKKVAESQALRKAFNVHGVYSPEEVGAGFETDHGEILVSTGSGATPRESSSGPFGFTATSITLTEDEPMSSPMIDFSWSWTTTRIACFRSSSRSTGRRVGSSRWRWGLPSSSRERRTRKGSPSVTVRGAC